MPPEDEECDACGIAVGLNAAIDICKENKELNCEDIKKRVIDGKITFQEALEEIKKGFTEKHDLEILEGIGEVVREESGRGKSKRDTSTLVDLIK